MRSASGCGAGGTGSTGLQRPCIGAEFKTLFAAHCQRAPPVLPSSFISSRAALHPACHGWQRRTMHRQRSAPLSVLDDFAADDDAEALCGLPDNPRSPLVFAVVRVVAGGGLSAGPLRRG